MEGDEAESVDNTDLTIFHTIIEPEILSEPLLWKVFRSRQ